MARGLINDSNDLFLMCFIFVEGKVSEYNQDAANQTVGVCGILFVVEFCAQSVSDYWLLLAQHEAVQCSVTRRCVSCDRGGQGH